MGEEGRHKRRVGGREVGRDGGRDGLIRDGEGGRVLQVMEGGREG